MEKQLETLIEMIYDSVTNENGWDLVMDTLVHDLDFRSGHFSLEALDQSGINTYYSNGISDNENQLFMDHFYKIDIWTEALAKKPPGKFYLSEGLARKTLKRSEFYNDFCKKIDVGYATGCYLETDGNYGIRMAFQHTHDQGSVGEKINTLNRLHPHLTRAVNLKQRMTATHTHASNISSILDQLHTAALITDEKGQIHYFNAQTESLLHSQDSIKVTDKQLAIDGVQERLNRLIYLCVLSAQGKNCPPDSNNILLYNPDGVAIYEIQVEPFCGHDQRFGFQYVKPLALITINELVSKHPLNTTILKDLYGLTGKELQLAEALVGGESLIEISLASHRSLNTLKTHLKSLFVKTNTTSQSKLVSRILTSMSAVRS